MTSRPRDRGVPLLCSRCGHPVGRYLPEAVRVRRRGEWSTITPPQGEQATGEVDIHCRTCDIDGMIDLAAVARQALPGIRKVKVRIRRVYG